MSSTVTLEIVNGPLAGKEFKFSEPTSCVIGRGSDCTIALPNCYSAVSRHHCVIEINPPEICVRDIGSLNGTFVNRQSIGQREQGSTLQQEARLDSTNHPLRHYDEIQLGKGAATDAT